MNPTDHAAKRAKLVQERDTLESQRKALEVASRELVAAYEKLDAEITTLDVTPVYPSVTFTSCSGAERRVEWDGTVFNVVGTGNTFVSAAQLASQYCDPGEMDAIVTRLLALKSEAASGEPVQWANVQHDGTLVTFHREENARRYADSRYAEIAVPLYRHPPTPVAYQKVGACVVDERSRVQWYWYVGDNSPQSDCERRANERAKSHGGTAHALYAGEALT